MVALLVAATSAPAGRLHIAGGSLQISAGRRYAFSRAGTALEPEAKLT